MDIFSQSDLQAIALTLRLAATVTIILLLVGTPIAWWLARTQSALRGFFSALVALPLVLPPTVLGFYLLLLMSPDGALGKVVSWLGLPSLAFTFSGLVVGSVFYSLPFVVQPIQNAFVALGNRPLEQAATLGLNPWQAFLWVVLPMAKPGFLTAAVLGFAHTVGEFGVVLMIGGSIPGQTRVISVQIYDHVEALDYSQAHTLAAAMVVFSFLVLLLVYSTGSNKNLLRFSNDR